MFVGLRGSWCLGGCLGFEPPWSWGPGTRTPTFKSGSTNLRKVVVASCRDFSGGPTLAAVRRPQSAAWCQTVQLVRAASGKRRGSPPGKRPATMAKADALLVRYEELLETPTMDGLLAEFERTEIPARRKIRHARWRCTDADSSLDIDNGQQEKRQRRQEVRPQVPAMAIALNVPA